MAHYRRMAHPFRQHHNWTLQSAGGDAGGRKRTAPFLNETRPLINPTAPAFVSRRLRITDRYRHVLSVGLDSTLQTTGSILPERVLQVFKVLFGVLRRRAQPRRPHEAHYRG